MMTKNFRKTLAFGTMALIAIPMAAPVQQIVGLPPPVLEPEFGVASWYGETFQGLHTASGELFDMHRMTAAHRRFPLGSLVRVVNLSNGRAVLVKVNDRGPWVPRTAIDLSMAAAEQLGMREAGRAKVRLDLLARN